MKKGNEYLRPLTEDENKAIDTIICNINKYPNMEIEVQLDTLNPILTGFIIELIKRVKASCMKINGCNLYEDRIVFNEKVKKK